MRLETATGVNLSPICRRFPTRLSDLSDTRFEFLPWFPLHQESVLVHFLLVSEPEKKQAMVFPDLVMCCALQTVSTSKDKEQIRQVFRIFPSVLPVLNFASSRQKRYRLGRGPLSCNCSAQRYASRPDLWMTHINKNPAEAGPWLA